MKFIVRWLALVVCLGVAIGIIVAVYGPPIAQSPAKDLPVISNSQGGPQPSASAPPTPANLLYPVSAFHPKTIKVYQMVGESEHDFIAESPMDQEQLDVDGNGDVVHRDASGDYYGPRQDPGVVVHPTRAWPGKDTGTTEVDCHARVYPQMVCTPLMDLPPGTDSYGTGDYRVDVTGPDGQLLMYTITEVVVLDKDDTNSRPEFNENTPNRLLIYTCQVDNGQPVVSDRIVVATLTSSKA